MCTHGGKPPNPRQHPVPRVYAQMGGNITLRSPPSDKPPEGGIRILSSARLYITTTYFNMSRRSRRMFAGRMHGFKRSAMAGTFQHRLSAKERRAVLMARRGGPSVIRPIVVPGITRRSGFFGRFGVGGELKFHDLDIDNATVASGATISQASCNLIPQGVTEVQRVGRKCTIRSINWRFQISTNVQSNTAAPATEVVRVILYLDKQANGASATTAAIVESDDFQTFNNLANKSRFRTLMDRTYPMNIMASSGADATAEWAGENITDTFFKKVNIPIEFDSTTGAITEIRSNNIGVLLLGKQGLAVFASKMRLRFSDN